MAMLIRLRSGLAGMRNSSISRILFFIGICLSIRIRISFIAKYVYISEEFVFVTEASTVQQNDSDRIKTDNKRMKNKTGK